MENRICFFTHARPSHLYAGTTRIPPAEPWSSLIALHSLPTPALVAANFKWRKPYTVAVGLGVKAAPRADMGSGSSKMSTVVERPSVTGGCDERTPEH